MSARALTALAALTLVGLPATGSDDGLRAQEPRVVLVLDFEVRDVGVFSGDDAEVASVARRATTLFRERVEADGRFALAVGGAGGHGSAGGSGASHGYGDRRPCRTDACTRELARNAGASLVVRGTYVKVSNLIRYLGVEVVDASSGDVIRSASAEVKGQRDVLLPRAVASLYDRLQVPAGSRSADAGG